MRLQQYSRSTHLQSVDKMAFLLLLVLTLYGSTSVVCDSEDNNTTLTLAVFISLSSPDVNGYNFLPSLDIALELINNRSDLLPGFELDAEVGDSAVS